MKFFYEIYNFVFILLLFEIKYIFSQIKDNYIQDVLENGNYEFLDVTDYHDMNIIVSTSKNIYIGIPTIKKVETTAQLISVTSLITINNNYLLAACLQDSLLGKISLTDGSFTSLLDYTDSRITQTLDIPITICSLSSIDNTIFIGYSKIEYFADTDETNKTNIIFELDITNKDDIINGPLIDELKELKCFVYPKSIVVSPSARQISCEPIRIKDDANNEFRLVCMHEGIYKAVGGWKNVAYATTIKSDLSDFEYRMDEFSVDIGTYFFSFRIFRENETYARCITFDKLIEIYLKTSNSRTLIRENSLPEILTSFNAEIDLFSYNNKFRFSVKKGESFMENDDIYSFQINLNYYPNYFKLYNYQESIINKIVGFYNKNDNKIILVYQTDNNIKYFIMDYMSDIFNFNSYEKIFYLGSYEEISYDLNDLITTATLSDLGNLNIATYKLDYSGESTLYYGLDFFELCMSNNIFNPDPSLNFKEIYTFSFIDNAEDIYTRIYHLANLVIKIKTCEDDCYSCWDGYYNCTDCAHLNYAILVDKEGECFPSTYIVENYIYDNTTNQFLKCYTACEFCSESGGTSSAQKCISCLPGYLHSYVKLGNCYKYTNLEITEEKKVSSGKFISATCSDLKIAATGECVDECPSTSPYYTYIYNNITQFYEKVNNKPPQYIFNSACYEECPNNYEPDEDNICVCNTAFYKDANDEIICLRDESCSNEYPFQYLDTKECFNSLDKCTYFFRDYCYDNCPEGKVELTTQSVEIQNYIKEKLSLDNNMVNKICICDTANGVWSNIKAEKNYFQECLNSCPYGYAPEEISKQCIRTNMPTTNIITTVPKVVTTTIYDHKITTIPAEPTTIQDIKQTSIPIEISTNIQSSIPVEIPTNNLKIITTGIQTTEIKTNTIKVSSNEVTEEIQYSSFLNTDKITPESVPPLPPPHFPINDQPNCPANFENRCYPECPPDTCLTQEDPLLKTCVRMNPNTQVFNGICFEHFESLINNIKSISENNEVIETNSGIIIKGYSTNSINNKESIDKDAKYSIVYLGDCENKLRSYYNLSNDTELFILGIDSPNKDLSATTNTYNYGVYLVDGTLLDHANVCKNTKISISSPITKPELIKLKEASYFSKMGFDIFDKNSDFYSDNCAPVSINGNDVVLSDRKNDFYPSNISLCNDSCIYSQVDFDSNRFICECDLVYNFSQKTRNDEEENEEEEEDIGYIEYFLSLINYKIVKCYELFIDYKSYYYNAGFYIAVGNLLFCIAQMIIFIKWGLKMMNKNISENIPNKMKLKELFKKQMKKANLISIKPDSKIVKFKESPPKKNKAEENNFSYSEKKLKKVEDNKMSQKNKKNLKRTVQVKFKDEDIPKSQSKSKSKTRKINKINISK